jgi:hypothetical protein
MLAIHLCTQAIDYSFGAACFMAFLLLARRTGPLPRASSRATARLWLAAALAMILCVGLIVGAIQYRRFIKRGSSRPPASGHAVAFSVPAARTALQAALGGQRGFVVWSSNREGNHDIYGMSLPERRIVRLTTNPCAEYFSRISPDGRFVVFCRGREPWVSQRNYAHWDIHLLDLQSGKERLLAEKGNVPTWSADGTKVRFQREGNQFVEHEVATGRERILFQAGRGDLPENTILETPVYSDVRHSLAVTLRGAWRATALVDAAGTVRRVGGGCELAWAPDSAYLFYVDGGGRMKNAIYRVDPDSLKRSLWLDLPGDYSHEYFPKVSNDGRFLVLGASSGGHEHDRADYEIFLWRIGTPPESAVRLTYHTGNDCWPDVFIDDPQGDRRLPKGGLSETRSEARN